MNTRSPTPPSRICPECGGDNHCTGDKNCWCMSKPGKLPVPAEGACRCERCFDAAAGQPANPPDQPQRLKQQD